MGSSKAGAGRDGREFPSSNAEDGEPTPGLAFARVEINFDIGRSDRARRTGKSPCATGSQAKKQVPRRVAKSATLARDDDASSRRPIVDRKGIVDQGVKRVKAGVIAEAERQRREGEVNSPLQRCFAPFGTFIGYDIPGERRFRIELGSAKREADPSPIKMRWDSG